MEPSSASAASSPSNGPSSGATQPMGTVLHLQGDAFWAGEGKHLPLFREPESQRKRPQNLQNPHTDGAFRRQHPSEGFQAVARPTAARRPPFRVFEGARMVLFEHVGEIRTSRIIRDLTSDPGPGVAFASSYRSPPPNPSARGPLDDYCDGVPVGSDSLATTTVRYMVEPIEPM